MVDHDKIYGARDDLDNRYEVLSTIVAGPGEVVQWCATGTFWKAEAVFELLGPHRARLGYANLALRDRWTNQTVRSAN